MLRMSGLVVSLSMPAAAGETLYFSHQDDRFLQGRQHDGGAAFVPGGVGTETPLPLVVFLHGTNSAGELHVWLGGGGRDLRPLASKLLGQGKVLPFVLAGPSQTRSAGLAHSLWNGFELSSFVDDVERATRGIVRIDSARVVLAGHSGAGCNPGGGLATDFWTAGKVTPLALVSIDPCLDEEMGNAFARRPSSVPLSVWWQSSIWQRSPQQFWSALLANKPAERIDRMAELPAVGRNPHDAIVPIAFERMVVELFPAPADAAGD
jgi:hypothetical protein